jgi:endonuclease/exonuclease/phosphatase family metal-dependent hydrolase
VQTPETNSLDVLLEGLGLRATHQVDMQNFIPPFSERYGGTAVATRWEDQAVEALDLRMAGATDVPWATVGAVVKIPDLGEMLFIGATAAWRPASEATRERQAIAITDLDARHRRGLPTVIAGDFNAGRANQIVRQPGYNRFDYVFVGSWDAHPKTYAHIQSARLAFDQPVDGVWASDHSALVVDLEAGNDA